MRHGSGRGTLAAASALVIAALLAAPAGADDDDTQAWPKLSKRDLAIVKCMVEGKVECNGRTQHEPDPELWPTEQEWLWLTETKLYSLPALSGPSAAEVFPLLRNAGVAGNLLAGRWVDTPVR